MTNKISIQRQLAIQELLAQERITDQNQIVERLRGQYQIETNQAAVSRDLCKLGVVKKRCDDQFVYELPTQDTTTEILKLAIVDVAHNEVMIVIKTHPGLADFVGDCLDRCHDLEVMGSLAGENVVFVIPKSIKKIDKICKLICQKIHFLR